MLMKRLSRHRFVVLIVTVAVGGGVYWLTEHLGLSSAAGFTVGSALAATLYIGRQYPAYSTATTWEDTRWGLLSAVLSSFIGISVYSALPGSLGLKIGILSVVVGFGWLGYTLGAIETREQMLTDPVSPNSDAYSMSEEQ
jgi:hypothetical protein